MDTYKSNAQFKGAIFFEDSKAVPVVHVHGSQGEELTNQHIQAQLNPALALGVVIEGQVIFYLDGKQVKVVAGTCPKFFCYNLLEHAKFEKYTQKGQRVNKLVVTIDRERLGDLIPVANGDIAQFLSVHLNLFESRADARLIETTLALQKLNQKENLSLMRDAKALEFIAAALTHFNVKKTTPRSNLLAGNIRAYIDTSLMSSNKTLNLTSLAKQLNMSTSKMQRIFSGEYQQTVGEYIQQQRLKAAKLALESGEASIGEAAFLAGYKHASNFCSAYKKAFGITPGVTAQA